MHWARRAGAVLLAVAVLAAAKSPDASAAPAEFPLQDGYFYTQTGGRAGLGFAVRDVRGVDVWSAYQDLGGPQALGYPVSRRWREGPFVYQAFQRAVLQGATGGRVDPVNIYDRLSAAGRDPWLRDAKGVPAAESLPSASGPLARLQTLAAHPRLVEFWRDAPNALTRFGLPLAYQPAPTGGVLRAQRAVLRLDDGVVRLAPSGDHYKQAGLIPRAMTMPEAPPAIPRRQIDDAHQPLVTSVAFHPAGASFATGGFDHRVVIWDRASGARLRELLGHRGGVFEVAYSPDGALLASASADATVRLWEAASGRPLHVLEAGDDWFTSVAFSPDGALLAATSYGVVRLWETAGGRLVRTIEGIEGWSNGAAFSADGQRLVTTGWAVADVWDVAAGERLFDLSGQHSRGVLSVALSPDGARIATGADDETAVIWNARDGSPILTLHGHDAAVWHVAFSPDGRRIATASGDETVAVWDAASGQRLYRLTGHVTDVQGLAYSPDGDLLISGGWDGRLGVWAAAASQRAAQTVFGAAIADLRFAPDGNAVAAALADGQVALVGNDGGVRLRIAAHDLPVNAVAFSPDGSLVASGGGGGRVRFWDARTGALRAEAPPAGAAVSTLAFTPDGAALAGDRAGVVRKLDAASGATIWTSERLPKDVTALAVRGPSTVAVGTFGEVWFLDAATGGVRRRVVGFDDWIRALAFDPHVPELAAADGAAVKILAANDALILRTIEPEAGLLTGLAYHPSGGSLALAAYRRVHLRDPTGRVALGRAIDAHVDWTRAVAVSADGALLATGGDDRVLRFWTTDPR